jgi:hypothetical protein
MSKPERSLFAEECAQTSQKRAEATRIPEPRAYDGPPTKHVLNLGDARALAWTAGPL